MSNRRERRAYTTEFKFQMVNYLKTEPFDLLFLERL